MRVQCVCTVRDRLEGILVIWTGARAYLMPPNRLVLLSLASQQENNHNNSCKSTILTNPSPRAQRSFAATLRVLSKSPAISSFFCLGVFSWSRLCFVSSCPSPNLVVPLRKTNPKPANVYCPLVAHLQQPPNHNNIAQFFSDMDQGKFLSLPIFTAANLNAACILATFL